MTRNAIFMAALAALLLSSHPAFAISLEPGNWQDTETGQEDGKPVPPQVTTDCMTPEEAKDPVKSLTAMKDQAGGQCSRLEVKQTGNVVTFIMQCGDPKQMMMDMQATYAFVSTKRYTGTLKSTVILAGKTSTANKQVESVWLGACKK